MSKCIFCDMETNDTEGDHHILPQAVRKQMGWKGQKFTSLQKHRVPMCRSCHKKFHILMEPLVVIIKWLRQNPPLPMDFVLMLEDTTTKLRDEDQKT